MDLDAVVSEEAQSVQEETDAGAAFLIGQNFRVGEARVVVDREVQVLPPHPAGVALSGSIPSNAMTDAIKLAELLMSMWRSSPGFPRS
jgi:hypothetical protein